MKLMSHPRCVAWGDCQLDYISGGLKTYAASLQRRLFAKQLSKAVHLNKPIIIRTRGADDDLKAILQAIVPKSHMIYMHSFTGSASVTRTVLENYPNAYFGVSPVVTYTKGKYQDFLKLIRSEELPLSRMLLQSGFPTHFPRGVFDWFKGRGLGNTRPVFAHSGMIPFTAECVAELINIGRRERGMMREIDKVDVEEVLDTTRRNAEVLFGINVS
jgi:TatD DNase family protein